MGTERGKSKQRIQAARERLRRGWGRDASAAREAPDLPAPPPETEPDSPAKPQIRLEPAPAPQTVSPQIALSPVVPTQSAPPETSAPPAGQDPVPAAKPVFTFKPAAPAKDEVNAARRNLVGVSVIAGAGILAGSLAPGLLGPSLGPSRRPAGQVAQSAIDSELALESRLAPAAGPAPSPDLGLPGEPRPVPLASADGPQLGPQWRQQDIGLQYASSPLPRHRDRRPERKIALYNENTGETVKATFWAGGDYVIEELDAVHRLLRDHHVDEIVAIDLKLLEILYGIQKKLEITAPFHILSAYRSPRTNAKLSRIYDGVAVNSFHIQGRALDIRLPGHSKRILLRAARALRAGGVGAYRSYIHIDTGPVRFW